MALAANWVECAEEQESIDYEEDDSNVECPDFIGDAIIEVICVYSSSGGYDL